MRPRDDFSECLQGLSTLYPSDIHMIPSGQVGSIKGTDAKHRHRMLQNEEIDWMEQKKLVCILTHAFISIKSPNTSLIKKLPKNPNNCVNIVSF